MVRRYSDMTMEANGHEIKINGHKLRFGVRDIIQLVVLALSVVGLYFVLVNRQNTSDVERSLISHKVDLLTTVVSDMDKNGSRRSHEIDTTQQQQIDTNNKQIDEITRELRDLSPKVDKIDTNVLWLMAKQLEHK